jgi:hypothetical protein
MEANLQTQTKDIQSTQASIASNQPSSYTINYFKSMTNYNYPIAMTSGTGLYNAEYNGVGVEPAESERRRSSATQIKNAWHHVKESLKEHHQGLNAAYEAYYGPYRVPQQSGNERRMS